MQQGTLEAIFPSYVGMISALFLFDDIVRLEKLGEQWWYGPGGPDSPGGIRHFCRSGYGMAGGEKW